MEYVKGSEEQKVAIVIENGIIAAVYSSNPEIQINIYNIDTEYVTSEEKESVYTELQTNSGLSECDFILSIPGYDNESDQ